MTLTGNRAMNNADYGIYSWTSEPPLIVITDGGGNLAHSNYEGQCIDIACG